MTITLLSTYDRYDSRTGYTGTREVSRRAIAGTLRDLYETVKGEYNDMIDGAASEYNYYDILNIAVYIGHNTDDSNLIYTISGTEPFYAQLDRLFDPWDGILVKEMRK